MLLKSGLLMSLLMNSSGARPVRPSHSGSQPALGAIRSGGLEMVDDASCVDMILDDVDNDDEGMTKAEAPVDARSNREVAAALAIFMMIRMMK
jgi:hypothetical protein